MVKRQRRAEADDPLSAVETLARERLGFQRLTPVQREVIQSVLAGRDSLAILPTGSGKSAIYQLAGLSLSGPTVVISPLLALQRDQVHALEHSGVEAAVVNSTVRPAERAQVLEEVADHHLDFLLIAPEQVRREDIREHLRSAGIALFVVDEAHCVSEWGESFRPDYLLLGPVIEELGHPPVLALTATAGPHVRDQIVSRLGMRDPAIYVAGFDRPNIWLGTERFHDERTKLAAVREAVREVELPGIVYVSTRKHAEDLAERLREDGFAAAAYHAGLKADERQRIESEFMGDALQVMVATSAFGMGIDKPNVRFVFHADIPESLDSYYQEIGRAGRDGAPASALLFFRPEDQGVHTFFGGTGQVGAEQLEQVAESLQGHHGPVDPHDLQEETDLSQAKMTNALTRLEEVGALTRLPTGEVKETRRLKRRPGQMVEDALTQEEHRRATIRSHLEMMRKYAEVGACRREFLLNYFGEVYQAPCKNCDNCQSEHGVVSQAVDQPFPLGSHVRHRLFGVGQIQRYEDDAMVVLFDDVGHKTLLTAFVIDSGVLSPIEDEAEESRVG